MVYRRKRYPNQKLLKSLPQRGTSNERKDKKIKALVPGRRVAASGRVYTETRKNRSDKKRRLT